MKKWRKKIWTMVIFFAVLYLLLLKFSTHLKKFEGTKDVPPSAGFLPMPQNYTTARRISTAWLYDKPITKDIVTNIGDLADNYPTLKVYVYCGTTQCVREVASLEKENVTVEFAVISDIVKGTPLEKWVAHHPINKLLTGLEFEKNLHEVTMLGILWQYGGYYVNPMVRIAKRSLPEYYSSHTTSVVSKDLSISKGSLSSVFDVSYFTRNHPIIKRLADVYVTKYQSAREHSPFKFDFMDTVWKTAHNECYDPPCFLQQHERFTYLNGQYDTTETNGYGILSHSKPTNLNYFDDDVENLAGLQYLPFVDTVIDRDNLRSFGKKNVTAFFNGKWRLSGDGDGLSLKPLNPIMLSVDLESDTNHSWMKNISFLKTQEPIGCRNVGTLKYLQAEGVKTFSSSSLMLLMKIPDPSFETRSYIYLVELKEEHASLLPLKIQKKALRLKLEVKKSNALAFYYVAAYQLMENFGSAKLVITGNPQLAMSCVAMETPVIYINTGNVNTLRVDSLTHAIDMYTMTKDRAKKWFEGFSWDDIPQNPNPAMLMRLRATSWNVIRPNQHLYDTAVRFGLVPMSPPISLQAESKLVFYLVFSTSNASFVSTGTKMKRLGMFNWRHWRTVESIFYHHPTAHVNVYSNTLPNNTFNVLIEAGYSILVQRYHLESLLVGTHAEGFIPKLKGARKEPYWYANVTNLLRLLLLYKWGGIYMDTDVIVVRPVDSLEINNSLGISNRSAADKLGNAFLKFEKRNAFLKECLKDFVKRYNGKIWGQNGPDVLTRVYKASKWSSDVVKIVKTELYFQIHWSVMNRECFMDTEGSIYDANMKAINTEAFVVHLNTKISGEKGLLGDSIKNGTICKHLLNSYCVICDQKY